MHFSTFLASILSVHVVCSAALDLDPRSSLGQWSTVANITGYMRQEHSTVRVGTDSIYVIGGILPEDAAGNPFPTVSLVQKYSISKNIWTTVAPMPMAFNHPNAAVVDGKIYVLGGLAAVGGIWSASNVSSVYDPATNKWTILPPFPVGRAIGSAAVGVDGTTIYLAGGLLNTILSNDTETTTTMFTSFNTASKTWARLPDLPAPRDHAGAGLVDKKLYILGGRAFGHWNVVNTVFSFDLCTNVWTTGLAPMPTARGGCASATIGTKIYTAGGEGDPNDPPLNVFYDMQAYDTATNKWTVLKNMTTALHGTSATSYGNTIYIPGGGTALGGFPTNLFEVFHT